MAQANDSDACDGLNHGTTEQNETPLLQEHRVQPSLNEKNGEDSALDVKKKRLLVELESVLLPKDKDSSDTLQNQDLPLIPLRSSFGIEVIDETALVLETLPASGIPKKPTTVNAKNGKQSRRKAKKDVRNKRVVSVTESQETSNGKRKYSRKTMEALRFVNVGEQRKFWKMVYGALEAVVAKEYETLAAIDNPKNVPFNSDPRQCLQNKKQAPPILSAVCCENTGSSENVSPDDPSCSHSLAGEDGCSILEECGEDDDSEDDYATSIQRPAFLVEGEPNFDSGPPEDGWEYLRRVRWEADRIPKVKVAKLDKSKLDKEQSDYMPKIPDIAKCPEHLLPLKQWEDVFIAEFSALRANLTCLEGSNIVHSSNLKPIHSSPLPGNNIGKSANITNSDVPLDDHLSTDKATDHPTNVDAEDKDTTLPPENPESNTSIDQSTSSHSPPTLPLLSAILGMDSVARVSMLLKRIKLLETANTITRNDCVWLFALCAIVDAPLDADTCAALRSLLRKCASIRAGKDELDEEVVMLNILTAISGRYFGQSEH